MVLVIFLVFVKCIVLVDVFNIGRHFIRCVVAFASLVAVGRVSLRVVNAFVSLKDGAFGAIVVRPAEVMIVIVGGVGFYRIEHCCTHIAAHSVKKRLISGERTLLVII